MKQKVAVVIDPASGTSNLGDQIISQSVSQIINECSGGTARIVSFSIHQRLSRVQIKAAKAADMIIAGGSNLLNFRYIPFWDGRWNNSLLSFLNLRDIILMGAGWQRYTDRSTALGRIFYKQIISKQAMHSVRDEFTGNMLRKHGITNVVNTSCPTMWGLTETHLSRIPENKSKSVVFTLTDYSQAPDEDTLLIDAIQKNYENVYFWPQGLGDLQYFLSLKRDGIMVLGPSLKAFDDLLDADMDVDYVGTRLHGGIRALQKARRTLIIAVDNRAAEISRDTGIPVIDRNSPAGFGPSIAEPISFDISLPWESIDSWKEQLRSRLS